MGRFSISKKKKIQNEIDFYNGELERTFIKISEKENTTYTNQNLQTDSREIEESEKRINEIKQIQQNNETRLGELNKLLNSLICFSPETIQNKNADVFGVISESKFYLFWTNSMKTKITNDYLSQNKINEVIVMPGITTIPSYAFKDCNSLKRVAISDSVTRIEKGAFTSCNGLVEITIPSGVIFIGESAFSMCEILSTVKISDDNLLTIEDNAFFGCKNLTTVHMSSRVQHIGNSAFAYCSKLKSITLPPNVVLGKDAFKSTKIE